MGEAELDTLLRELDVAAEPRPSRALGGIMCSPNGAPLLRDATAAIRRLRNEAPIRIENDPSWAGGWVLRFPGQSVAIETYARELETRAAKPHAP